MAFFFEGSKGTSNQITEIFDFVWPTATAMWNLRWQVAGYVAARPGVTYQELSGRFTTGSGIHGANLERACITRTWEQQQEQLARFLLINLFAIYESWLAHIFGVLDISDKNLQKQFEFPTGGMRGNNQNGIWNVINIITSPESQMLKQAFYAVLLSNNDNAKSHLDNLLHCYRYFKECRNSIVHRGSKANSDAESAYNNFSNVATTTQLDLKEVPLHYPTLNGQKVEISLRGVVGFSKVILRLIATIDAELSRSAKAEEVFLQRWKQDQQEKKNRKVRSKITLKTKEPRAIKAQISGLVKELGFPRPQSTSEIERFLRRNSLVS